MRNLIPRGDTWHFRGYVPKDLINVIGKREVHRSLGTEVYSEAVHRRDAKRIRHREAMDEARRRHHQKFLVVDELTDEQILDIAREVYGREWKTAQGRRDEFAERVRASDEFHTGGYEAMHDVLRRGVVIGEDRLHAASLFTNQILRDRMIDLSKSPTSYRRLKQRILETVAQVQSDLLDMISCYPGKHANPALLDPETGLPRQPSFDVDARPGRTSSTKYALSPLIEEFLEDVRLRRRDKGFNSIRASMRLVQSFFGPDTNVDRIRRRQCNQFRDFVMRLPSNYTKRYPKAPLNSIPELRKPEHHLMSYANVNKILRHLVQFLRWCEEMEVVERAPSSHNLILRDPVSEKEKRQPFTNDQLRQIFTSPMMKAEAASRSMFFWCYVVGLYQGLRLNEIAGMDAECIRTVDGNPCIDIHISDGILNRENFGGTKTMPRTIPMHWVLIELGHPEFASARPPGAKLFDEARTGADGYLGREVSDTTRSFLDSLEIPVGGPTFHSLRHCFRDAMTEADVSQDASAFLGGWKQSGTMNTVYGSVRLKPSFKEHLDRVSYGEIDELVLALV